MEQEQELIAINLPGDIVITRSPFKEDIPSKKYVVLKNITLTLSMIIAIILYQSGLKKCPHKTENQCTKEFLVPNLPSIIRNDQLSIIIYGIIVLLYKQKKASGVFVCMIPVILIYQLFLTSHEMTQESFKILYQLIYGTLILFALILTLISYAILKLFKKFGYKFLIGMILIAIFAYFSGKQYIMKSCSDWKSGLQGKRVSGGTCQIIDPQYCWYDFFDGVQDFSKYYNKCKPNYYNKQSYLQRLKEQQIEIPDSTNYVVYPRTEKFDEPTLYLYGTAYQYYVLNQTKFLPDLQRPEDNELYLDLNNFQFHMNITKNETLIQERKELANKFKNKKRPKNIITVWVDAVSRPRFMKKMKKSTQKLSQISEEKDRILFQGFKYTALAGHTSPNLKAYEYGYVNYTTQVNSENWSKNIKTIEGKHKSISKELKELGYIIGKARTQCNTQIQEFEKVHQSLFEPQFADHESIGIPCDIMSQSPKEPYSISEGPYSIFRRCINEKDQHAFVFDYAKQFLTTYKDEDKYLEIYFTDGHEGSGEVMNYLDDPMNEFFDFLSQNNHDEDSVIILLSDHGLHMQGIAYLLGWKIYEIERSLPGMFILADKSLLNEEDQNNLYKNEQNTITIMDLRYFLKFLIGEDEQFYRNNSLISPILDRTCKDIPMVKDEYCPCV